MKPVTSNGHCIFKNTILICFKSTATNKNRTMTKTHPESPPSNITPNANSPSKNKKPVYTKWTRLNYKGIYHDNRRLLKHRAKNCKCFVCYREIYKLPPMETLQESIASSNSKKEEREIKKAKRIAKKEVKAGKQRTINGFFPLV